MTNQNHYPSQNVMNSDVTSQSPDAYVLHHGLEAICQHLADLTSAITGSKTPDFSDELDRIEFDRMKLLLDEFALLVNYLVDDEYECSLDHHGYCQAHQGGFMEGGCWNPRAVKALKAYNYPIEELK